ncbi:MAG: N-acetylmuramoyl-L-alanine amidase [Selenomonadaceae bacterium]|nr:N-acetylmuramoyl-L-alanine amidase [Selenomonadaceae bacterium]
MIQAKIVEKTFDFRYSLDERSYTDMIVVHHTGCNDIDASAEQIHDWHLNNEWSGIGYHFVIRKNGTIERGRPVDTIGSHAYGENSHSIGIHLSGDFEQAYPTQAQIESAALLIANLCEKYNIPVDRTHIVGHRDLMATDCPGKNLYAELETIIGKANWYRYYSDDNKPAPDVIDTPSEPPKNILTDEQVKIIASLSAKYESSGDPACVANNAGDLGGISYGTYQFASNVGSVDKFVDWLKNYPDDKLANYGRVLAAHKINSPEFIRQWQELGTVDPGNFGRLQDEYMVSVYYDGAAEKLRKENFHLEKHSDALKAVVFSRAVQNGQTGCRDLFVIACQKLGQPNLSYIDDAYFDEKIISAIYDFLISECDLAMPVDGVWRSPDDFCHGSKHIIGTLRNRFVHEKQDVLNLIK